VCRVDTPIYFQQDPTVISHFRITAADVFFNPNSDTPYSFDPTGVPAGHRDFQGVATHEIGHWLRLVDVQGSDPGCIHNNQRDTMCGTFYSEADSFFARTLTADDISSANTVYP
jgi:hypothetical protein